MSRIWSTPEITVLVKRSSDEFLVDQCKGSNGTAISEYSGCKKISGGSANGPGDPNELCAYDHCSYTKV